MKRLINPASMAPPLANYSHAITVSCPETWLFASGQLGVALDRQIPDDIEAQCILCFENLRTILTEADMSFENVVRFNAFVTDRAFFGPYGKVRERYVSGAGFASTLAIVSGFTRPEFKIEVEITAVRAIGDFPQDE